MSDGNLNLVSARMEALMQSLAKFWTLLAVYVERHSLWLNNYCQSSVK